MSKNIKILFISHEPLTKSLSEMYCIDKLSEIFEVQFLSLRSYYYKKSFKYEDELKEKFIDFKKASSFIKYIKKNHNESTYLFIDNSSRSLKSIIINKFLKKYKLNHFILYQSFIGKNFSKNNIFKKILYYKDLNRLKFKIVSLFRIKKYNMVFSAGTIKPSVSAKKYINLNCSVCYINDKEEDEKDDDLCVFIDQGYPTHPDLLKRNGNDMKTKEFISLYNDFFDWIEKKFKCKVVIAKHPKSSVSDECFDGRDIVVNQTAVLIKKSKLVIAHHSHINNVAIQYYKPIILIYNDEMYKFSNNVIKHLNKLSELLGVNLVNITDKNKYYDVDIKLDKNKYNNYINDYIVVNHNKNNHQIISESILNDYYT